VAVWAGLVKGCEGEVRVSRLRMCVSSSVSPPPLLLAPITVVARLHLPSAASGATLRVQVLVQIARRVSARHLAAERDGDRLLRRVDPQRRALSAPGELPPPVAADEPSAAS
jgi:hypothetical protein